MATRYYIDSVDNNWSTAGNWWTDAGHTIALGGLPASTDSVVLSAVLNEPAYVVTVVNLTTSYDFAATLTCSLATFNSTAINTGDITGTAIFNGTSDNQGSIVGNVTFNGSATHSFSSIAGDVTFNGTSQLTGGYILGACIFNGSSTASTGTITGGITFNDSAELVDVNVLGDCTFNDTSKSLNSTGTFAGDVVYNDSSYNQSSVIVGDVVFNDSSQNKVGGDITGTVTFNDNSENLGTVTGNAKVYQPVVFPLGGTVTGAIDYYGYNFAKGICQVTHAGAGVLAVASTVNLPAGVCNVAHTNFCTQLFSTVSVPQGTCNVKFTNHGHLSAPDTGFTVSQAVNEILTLWGGCGGDCDSKKIKQALNIINSCLQEIYLNAKDLQYLSNETITVLLTGQDETIDPGLDYFEMPDSVQAIVGPVYYVTNESQTIIPGVKTKGQIIQHAKLYQTPGKAPVMAYFVESTAQLEGERCNIRVYTPLNPLSGSLDISLTLDIQREIPRYRETDCRNGTRLPIPHQYAESLLLPLIREEASASPYCSRRDSYPMYQAKAAASRRMYGMADPQNPAIDGTYGKGDSKAP